MNIRKKLKIAKALATVTNVGISIAAFIYLSPAAYVTFKVAKEMDSYIGRDVRVRSVINSIISILAISIFPQFKAVTVFAGGVVNNMFPSEEVKSERRISEVMGRFINIKLLKYKKR